MSAIFRVFSSVVNQGLAIVFVLGFSFSSWSVVPIDRIEFLPAYDCEKSFKPIQYCIVTDSKDFTDDEKEFVLKAFAGLPPQSKALFDEIIQKKEKIQFLRFRSGATHVKGRTYKRDDSKVAWVELESKNRIQLTDAFFDTVRMINDQHSLQEYIIVHESAHLFDNLFGRPSFSMRPFFLKAYGWKEVETGEVLKFGSAELKVERWQPGDVSYEKVDEVRAEVNRLWNAGDRPAATALTLGFGQKHGHPTSYSMTNPYENFAEIISHYLLDPESMKTTPQAILDWLDALFL